MDIVRYTNVIYYKRNFYVDREQIREVFTHNRLTDEEYRFTPQDIETMRLPEPPVPFDKGVLLLDHFHFNPAHMMWDHVYPSWYGLYNHQLGDIDFQWVTTKGISEVQGAKHRGMVETFSGNPVYCLDAFSNTYDKPLRIPWLITGLGKIGISHIDKETLHVERGLTMGGVDPIEMFVNRMYSRYKIERNTQLDMSICNNVIYIVNKRTCHGMEDLFKMLNEKYSGKYNFKIVNYETLTFEQQLCLVNTTCLCVVGVGTARFNTPFLPNGAVEIQTFDHSTLHKNYIQYVDYHGGTLSRHVKVRNIPHYTREETESERYSHYLEEYIEQELANLPCSTPVCFDENIPIEIRELKKHPLYEKLFDEWRNSHSNILEHFVTLLGGYAPP